MKKFAYFSILVLLLLPACAPAADTACESVNSFAIALRADGAEVEIAELISQEFFSVPAQHLVVNGEDLQVLAYPSVEVARQDAALVSADGYEIGTAMVTWIATPHFFQCDKLIVLYLGDNADIFALLEGRLGPQFAGG